MAITIPAVIERVGISRTIAIALTFVLSTEVSTISAATFRPAQGAESCEVHLVPVHRGAEVVGPCGAPVIAPAGEYDGWLESEERITPFLTRIVIARGDEQEYRWPLEAAGLLTPNAPLTELFSIENRTTRAFHRPSFGASTRMPVGASVALARDDRGEPIGISRPVPVASRSTIDARPVSPERGADLLVILDRPPTIAVDAADILLAATIVGQRHLPDVVAVTADRVTAVWYALPAGRLEITAASQVLRLPPTRVVLRDHRAEVVDATLLPLPSLRVTVAVPAEALQHGDALSLRVTNHDDARTSRTLKDVKPGVAYDLEHLPAAPLDVDVMLGRWTVHRDADLSAGSDGTLLIELEPLLVTGTVTYAGAPADADVGFTSDPITATQTDEKGRYRITLWEARRYGVRVKLRGMPDVPPFMDTVRIDESRDFDIEVPRARHQLNVVDEGDGHPISNAHVTLTSAWKDVLEGQRHLMTSLRTDAKGEALLPPLRTGTVQLRVDAEGYFPTTVSREVAGGDREDVRLEARMRSTTSAGELTLLLPNGNPAVGTEWIAVRDGHVILNGTVGQDGLMRVPNNIDGALLVARHPIAAGVQVWHPGESAKVWSLLPAGPPIQVEAVDVSGAPAGSAPIVIWADGRRLSGIALAFLSRFADATSTSGTWIGRNLPAVPLRVLACKRGTSTMTIESGAFDVLAVPVTFPWPSNLRVRIAE